MVHTPTSMSDPASFERSEAEGISSQLVIAHGGAVGRLPFSRKTSNVWRRVCCAIGLYHALSVSRSRTCPYIFRFNVSP